ncbi:hypothetical protein ABBQ38_006839 [Trebouxia sp. C0009 RCD-2024]
MLSSAIKIGRVTLSASATAKANDGKTIGKFGKGALTAYSLTDVIQIFSGDSLLILDPHGTHLHDQLPSVFGNVVNKEDKHFVDVYADSPDQLNPFLSFTRNCSSVPTLSTSKHYPGTLFRLALRTETAAQHSEISKESLSPDQIAQALHHFAQAAPDLLLFTRHVKGISVWTKESQHSKCTLMHECSASMRDVPSPMPGCQLQEATISIQRCEDPQAPRSETRKVWLKSTHSVKGQSGDVALLMHSDGNSPCQHLPNVVGKVYSTMALPLALLLCRSTSMGTSVYPLTGAPCGLVRGIEGRKWPTAYTFQPEQLNSITSATVAQLVANDCKVFWAPAATGSSIRSSSGKWVVASEACLVQPSDYMASAVTTAVGRRAGLQIPEAVPEHVCRALSALPAAVTLFSPDKLRKALLSAGNIVQPEEVSAVLSYVTSDGRYEDLIGPHLILLQHGSVQQMQKNTSMAKKYFVFTNAKSETIYKLMEGNKDELVKEHSIWTTLAR